nr:hypothetical protein [Deltaproteobacteria bacterium]
MRRNTALFAAALWTSAGVASAQEADTPSSGPLHLHSETARIVDVVDSFDAGSQFSLRLTAGYQFQRRDLRVQREMRVSNPGTSLGVPQYGDVADYTRSTHTLLVNAEVGLFHDLAFTFGLPLVLSDARKLRPPSGGSVDNARAALADGWTEGPGTPRATYLFDPSFDSPERSGIDQVSLGLQWSIFNQQRDRNRPTWTLSFQWRPPVGSLMRPCRQTATGTFCPEASSVPETPASGNTAPAAAARSAPANPDPGISRGLHGVYFQTMVSRRLGYIEPYAGLDFLAEFPIRDSAFRYADTPLGQLSNFPPIVGTLTAGMEIIPWENRETWQRLLIDLRFRGAYYSPGRDYSALYDALGSSLSRPLNLPGCPSNARDPMTGVTCQAERNVYFDGLTTTASHVVLGGSAMVSVQPAKFLRFTLGAAFAWTSPHTITNTDACNPGQTVQTDHPEYRGGCQGNSSPDPTHRPVIDSAGGRFRSTNDITWDFYAAIALTPRIW